MSRGLLKKLVSVPGIYLLLVGVVAADLVIFGSVVAQILMPAVVDVGDRMVNEEFTVNLAMINQTVTDAFNVSTVCLGSESINMRMEKPIGSDSPSTLDVNLNGTTIINPKHGKLEVGNITLTIRAMKQGDFNCTMVPSSSNNTVLTWVDEL